jgi:hypothetical protein
MSSKFGHNQMDVLNIWASGSRAKARAGRLRTEHGCLYSYDLCIGIVTRDQNLRLVYDYTSGGVTYNVTTRRHVAKAKRLAHFIYPVNLSGNVVWTDPRLGPVIENWRMHVELVKESA